MRSNKYSWLLLVVGFMLLYLVPLEFRALWQPDETRYAEISREMLQSGDWIVPHFLGIRYFEKPVAGYWINNLSQLIFGHSNFAVRFGVVFSSALSALLVAWLALQIFREKQTAITSAVIFLTCLLVYGVGTYSVLDPMISLWMTAAMCCFWWAAHAERTLSKIVGYLLLGVACGMGVMTKGFLALAVPVISVLPWVVMQKRWKEVLLFGPLAIISAVLVTLPWALAIARQESDFWRYFFWVEHIQRFAQQDAQHNAPFWYYFPVIIAGSLPWLALLPGALQRSWQARKAQQGGLYLLCWVVMPFLFFSIAKGKLPTYILPCFAPLAILLAHHARALALQHSVVLKVNSWINIAFGLTGIVLVLLVLSPWGVAKHSLYHQHELFRVFCAVLSFLVWAGVGYLTLRKSNQRWLLAAGCPLGLALLVGFAIPEKIIDSKQPQPFIENVYESLGNSRYILADNIGLAAGVAWQLQRSDILLYVQTGELAYGLKYPEAQHRLVKRDEFAAWLKQHRAQGKVSVVLLRPRVDKSIGGLPAPDALYREGRFVLLQYYPQ